LSVNNILKDVKERDRGLFWDINLEVGWRGRHKSSRKIWKYEHL